MHFSLTDYVLWLASSLCQVGVLVALFKRGLYKEYPYFCNYTILQVVSTVFLLCVQGSLYLYYYGYWVSSALCVLISFAVLQEIFKEAFRPYEALRDLSVILFRWSALVLVLFGGMWAISTHLHADGRDSMTNLILLADRSVRLMQCGLVFFLLLFSEYLGISRRHVLFGIALGFGLFASVNMLVATGIAHPGHYTVLLRRINCGAYDVAALIWLAYTALAPSRSAALSAMRTPEWNTALEDARVPAGADSLLDSMDRTVERLLYPRDEIKVSVPAGTRS